MNEAERGLLPAEATIVCGQPMAVDPSRAPDGSWIIWIQLQELPAGRVKGDAAGEIDVGEGSWTEELREAYADRITARLGRHIQNLERATLKRVVLSPAEIEALNVNLVGGDIYGGSCALDQNFLFRPLAQAPGHRTAVDNLWHIGASTHPGPGLGAGSGYIVYKELTKAPLPRRLLCASPGAQPVKLSLSEISTVNASFAEDVAAYAAAGFDGIGIWEMKLPADDAANVASPPRGGTRRRELRPGGSVDPSAGHPRDGRSAGSARAHRMRCAPACGGSPLTNRSASSCSPDRRATRARVTSSWQACRRWLTLLPQPECASGSSRHIPRSTSQSRSSTRSQKLSLSSTRRASTIWA